MYTTKRLEATLNTAEYYERFVDIPAFLKLCQACPNYEKTWSCPPFDFDVESYWLNYQHIYLCGTQILYDHSLLDMDYTKEEIKKIIEDSLWKEKKVLNEELLHKEHDYKEAVSLSAGHCELCAPKECCRPSGHKCRQPDKMRHSIESLGGDIGKTVKELFHIDLKWVEDGKLPEYFVIICALLYS